jgi:hypothetical protein
MTINGTNSKALPSGIYVPVVTFFQATPDQDLDIETHVRHIRMLAEAGVDGVVVQGSTGEAVALSHQERIEVRCWSRDKLSAERQLIRTAKETFTQAGNSGLIIAGTVGAQSTVENVLMCQEAAAAGADFALVLPPSYYPSFMTDEVIEAFYVQVRHASGSKKPTTDPVTAGRCVPDPHHHLLIPSCLRWYQHVIGCDHPGRSTSQRRWRQAYRSRHRQDCSGMSSRVCQYVRVRSRDDVAEVV